VERWMTGKWRHCRWWDWNDWTEREYIGRVWCRCNRTTRRQTNLPSVKSCTGQLAD